MTTFDFSFDKDFGESILNASNQLSSELNSKCSDLMSMSYDFSTICGDVGHAISDLVHMVDEEISSLNSLESEVNRKIGEIKTKRSHLIPPHDEVVEVKDSEGNVVDRKTIHVDPDRAQREKYDQMIDKCGKFIDQIDQDCSKCEDAKSGLSPYLGNVFESDAVHNSCESIENARKNTNTVLVCDVERDVKSAIHYAKSIEKQSRDFSRNAFSGRKGGRLPNIFVALQSRISTTTSSSSYTSTAVPVSAPASSTSTLNGNDETKTTNETYKTFRIVRKLNCDELRLNYDCYCWDVFDEEFARYINQTNVEYIIKVSIIGINRRNANGWDEFANNIAKYGLKYDEKDGAPKLNINKEAIFRVWVKE